MSNILIVGGAGYVGGAVTDLLVGGEHPIRVYDNILDEDSYRKPIDFVFGDVRDETALKPHLDWADVVVWLAAIVGDGACQLDPDTTIKVSRRWVYRMMLLSLPAVCSNMLLRLWIKRLWRQAERSI